MSAPLPLCAACGAELQPDAEACFCCGRAAPRARPARRREASLLFALAAFGQVVGLAAILYGGFSLLRGVFQAEVVDKAALTPHLYVFGSGVVAGGVGCFLLLVHRQRGLAAE